MFKIKLVYCFIILFFSFNLISCSNIKNKEEEIIFYSKENNFEKLNKLENFSEEIKNKFNFSNGEKKSLNINIEKYELPLFENENTIKRFNCIDSVLPKIETHLKFVLLYQNKIKILIIL